MASTSTRPDIVRARERRQETGLTPAQEHGLELLLERPRRTTTKSSMGYLGGRTAEALIVRGFAARRRDEGEAGRWEIHATDDGRRAARAVAAREPDEAEMAFVRACAARRLGRPAAAGRKQTIVAAARAAEG